MGGRFTFWFDPLSAIPPSFAPVHTDTLAHPRPFLPGYLHRSPAVTDQKKICALHPQSHSTAQMAEDCGTASD